MRTWSLRPRGRRGPLFRVFGIPIHVDPSWFLILALVTWTLATRYFPSQLQGFGGPVYWAMGLVAAVLLFVCVLLHELGHSLVAKSYGIHVSRVTLFIFGGVAQIAEDPRRPGVELRVALAGPLVSVVIAVVCYGLSQAMAGHLSGVSTLDTWVGLEVIGYGIVRYLAVVNTVILVFNLLPGFPLDGGRVLRALLWSWSGNFAKATRITSAMGSGLGIALLVLGAVSLLRGGWVGGMWYIFLGLFLRDAAKSSYQDALLRNALEGMTVAQVMGEVPVTVPSDLSIQRLVDEYLRAKRLSMVPVVDGEQLRGVVTVEAVRAVARTRWSSTAVADVMRRETTPLTIRPDEEVMVALTRVAKIRGRCLLVVDQGQLLGMIRDRDMMALLQRRLEEKR